MQRMSCILLAALLLALLAGCASKSQQGAVSTSAKDWQHVPPSPGYIAFMKSHPMGPPPPPAGYAKAGASKTNTASAPAPDGPPAIGGASSH